MGDIVFGRLENLFEALAGRDVATALTSGGFIYIFIQVALVAPLAEEFAKPLITLPLLKYAPKREAFLLGAMAGAGFAALENMLYAGFGFYFWAVFCWYAPRLCHPSLGAGLVALGWRDLLNGEENAGRNFIARFGLAVGMHALWNGGSLLVITLAGAEFLANYRQSWMCGAYQQAGRPWLCSLF